MSTVKLMLCVLLLAAAACAQTITLGPLVNDVTGCKQDPVLTSLCFAKNVVYVSFGGGQFVAMPQGQPGKDGKDGKDGQAATIGISGVNNAPPGSLPQVQNLGTPQQAMFYFTIPQGEKGDKGDQGAPGVVVGSVLSGTLTCQPSRGTISAGFTSSCTFTVAGVK